MLGKTKAKTSLDEWMVGKSSSGRAAFTSKDKVIYKISYLQNKKIPTKKLSQTTIIRTDQKLID